MITAYFEKSNSSFLISLKISFVFSNSLLSKIVLNNFKNDIGLLTSDNVENYIKISEEKALNYNVFEIADKISEYLKNNK